jgi:outer membrane receptor protein involved in Fe transport
MSVVSIPVQAAYFQSTTTVSGTVTDTEGEPLAGANIRVKGKVIGTSTDTQGRFELNVNLETPFTIVVSIVGFTSQEFEITQSVTELNVELSEQPIVGDDVVVSASRVEESILKSPVAIEKLDAIAIQSTPAPSFYDAILNLKGVDFSAQSLTFKSINTRGFAANGNTRFVQLIDGIDNQAPGLNFPVGNVVGISELDLESAELIPGVASALYGPNALNGILLLNSKSPFDYKGLSFSVKQGINHVDNEDDDASLFQDYSLRYADVINDKLAFKFNFSYLRANDFIGSDFRDQGPGTFGAIERGATERGNNRVYDGLNIYGDPVLSIGSIADGLIAGGDQSIAAIRSLLPDGTAGA